MRLAWVCSASHGQPPGERSRSITATTSSSRAPGGSYDPCTSSTGAPPRTERRPTARTSSASGAEPDDGLAGQRPGVQRLDVRLLDDAPRRRRRAGTAAAASRASAVRTGPDRSASQAGQDSSPGGTLGDSATRTMRPPTPGYSPSGAGDSSMSGGCSGLGAGCLAGRRLGAVLGRRRRDAVRALDRLDAAGLGVPARRSAG